MKRSRSTSPGNTYRLFNFPSQHPQQLLSKNGKYFTLPGKRHQFVCGGCDAGDSKRNSDAKLSIIASTTPVNVKYIFIAGGHGRMVDNGMDEPAEAQYAIPACTTIFPNYLGEKAISGASKHTIVNDLVELIRGKQQQQQGRFSQGDFLKILETENVQKIDGCPAITVYRHRQSPLEMMHNLYMFGKGGIHSEDFLNAGTRNPSCLYMINVETGVYEDLAPKLLLFKDNITDWRTEVGAAVAAWTAANPSDTRTRVEKMRAITAEAQAANPKFSPTPPNYHYVKHDDSRITLADVTDVITAKMTELGASPEQCLLYVIACRRCDTSCNVVRRVMSSSPRRLSMSSSGGKTKKRRRRRNRTRSARYRSRQVRRHTRTKRTKRK
jgi:hypothetical protein